MDRCGDCSLWKKGAGTMDCFNVPELIDTPVLRRIEEAACSNLVWSKYTSVPNYTHKRLSTDNYFIEMTKLVADRGTCARRKVGAIAVNIHNHILSTGYNGVPSGFNHCIDTPCAGAECASGEGLDECLAIHAEQNMLLQCPDVMKIATVYCTDSPCITCLKMLLNTSCKRIVFVKEYPHPMCKGLWESRGRIWEQNRPIDKNN